MSRDRENLTSLPLPIGARLCRLSTSVLVCIAATLHDQPSPIHNRCPFTTDGMHAL